MISVRRPNRHTQIDLCRPAARGLANFYRFDDREAEGESYAQAMASGSPSGIQDYSPNGRNLLVYRAGSYTKVPQPVHYRRSTADGRAEDYVFSDLGDDGCGDTFDPEVNDHGFYLDYPKQDVIDGGHTLIFRVHFKQSNWPSYATNCIFGDGANLTLCTYVDLSGGYVYFTRRSSGYHGFAIPAVFDGKFHTFAYTLFNDAYYYATWDGRVMAEGSAAGYSITTGNMRCGVGRYGMGYHPTYSTHRGRIAWMGYWTRPMAIEELRSVSDNPWQLFTNPPAWRRTAIASAPAFKLPAVATHYRSMRAA